MSMEELKTIAGAKDDDYDDPQFPDRIVPVSMTVHTKYIEDIDGELCLVGTLIYRLVDPPPKKEVQELWDKGFPIRINDLQAELPLRDTGLIEVRNTDKKVKGKYFVHVAKLPLKLVDVKEIQFPFRMLKARLKIEFGSVTIGGIKYRPSIMDATDRKKHRRELVCIKNYQHERVPPNAPLAYRFDAEKFDQSINYDTISPVPRLRVCKGLTNTNLAYYPMIELEYSLESPYLKFMVSTLIPMVLLSALQWINYLLHLVGDVADADSYFSNSISIVLSLIVLIPSVSQRGNTLRAYLGPIEWMVFFYFLGTGLSSFPSTAVSFIGLLITSVSVAFPFTGYYKYHQLKKAAERDAAGKLADFIFVKKGDKRGARVVDFDAVCYRTEGENDKADFDPKLNLVQASSTVEGM